MLQGHHHSGHPLWPSVLWKNKNNNRSYLIRLLWNKNELIQLKFKINMRCYCYWSHVLGGLCTLLLLWLLLLSIYYSSWELHLGKRKGRKEVTRCISSKSPAHKEPKSNHLSRCYWNIQINQVLRIGSQAATVAQQFSVTFSPGVWSWRPWIESHVRLPAWSLLLPLPVSLPLSLCVSMNK